MTKHLPQIITHLSDNDFYKFTMGQMFVHQFHDVTVEWTYKNRDPERKFTREMIDEINYQIDLYSKLRFTQWELDNFLKIDFMKGDYVRFLKRYTIDRSEITCVYDEQTQQPEIHFRGYNVDDSYHEVPVMSIVSEVWFRMTYSEEEQKKIIEDAKERARKKIDKLIKGEIKLGAFSEFGTRRRFCKEFQEWLIRELLKYQFNGTKFVGTSNVYLAFLLGTKPIGTMAHEAIELVGQGFPIHNPAYSNHYMMKHWIKEYGIKNGIYLTDCITTDCFLKDFHVEQARLFSGLRHDSGDPMEWGEKMLAHYQKLGVSTKDKTLLFSDSLDFAKAEVIYQRFALRCNVAFGIGTWLVNDTGHFKAMNQVIKLTEVNGIPVCKISDAAGKFMGKSEKYRQGLQYIIDLRMQGEM
jgi:nicotinate phosphoribosyltransferase